MERKKGEKEKGGEGQREKREYINYRQSLKHSLDSLVIRLNISTEIILFSTASHLKGHFLQKATGQMSVGYSNHEFK